MASIQSCRAARWSSQTSSSWCRDRRASSSAPQLLKRALGFSKFGLPMVQLVGEFAAQLQKAVHHLVDDAQHQVGRAGGQARAAGVVGRGRCRHSATWRRRRRAPRSRWGARSATHGQTPQTRPGWCQCAAGWAGRCVWPARAGACAGCAGAGSAVPAARRRNTSTSYCEV